MRIHQVDAFTDRPFGGNPAAVCVLDEERSDEWMRAVAREMNLSETAFLSPRAEGFGLRWFTPAVEVDLCGHATLASAHVLWESGRLGADEPAVFFTRSGRLSARRRGDWIEMDFPADPPRAAPPPAGLTEALGAPLRSAGRSRLYDLAEVEDETVLRGLRPDFRGIGACVEVGVIVTCAGQAPGIDFVSRFFAPGVGVDEDPVTGSAHCVLAPFWAERLGKQELIAYQASARGGVVKVEMAGERVLISGQAVTVLSGELL